MDVYQCCKCLLEQFKCLKDLRERSRRILVSIMIGASVYSLGIGLYTAYMLIGTGKIDIPNFKNILTTRPITNISIVNSHGSCPKDFEMLLDPNDMIWPGTASGACACPMPGKIANSPSSSELSCSHEQIIAGCATDPAIGPIASVWHGIRGLCVQRHATARLFANGTDNHGKTRLYPRPMVSMAACPTGWRACIPNGTRATTPLDGSACVRDDAEVQEPCPLTGIALLTRDQLDASNGTYQGSIALPNDESLVLAYTVAHPGGVRPDAQWGKPLAPLQHFELTLGQYPCLRSDGNPDGVRSWYAVQGSSTAGDGSKWDDCSLHHTYNTLFSDFATVGVQPRLGYGGHLHDTFAYSERCTVDPARPEVPAMRCSPNDTICERVSHTGRCEKLQRFAAMYTKDPTVNVSLVARKEMWVSPYCPDIAQLLAGHMSTSADDLQYAAYVAIALNLFVSLVQASQRCTLLCVGFAYGGLEPDSDEDSASKSEWLKHVGCIEFDNTGDWYYVLTESTPCQQWGGVLLLALSVFNLAAQQFAFYYGRKLLPVVFGYDTGASCMEVPVYWEFNRARLWYMGINNKFAQTYFASFLLLCGVLLISVGSCWLACFRKCCGHQPDELEGSIAERDYLELADCLREYDTVFDGTDYPGRSIEAFGQVGPGAAGFAHVPLGLYSPADIRTSTPCGIHEDYSDEEAASGEVEGDISEPEYYSVSVQHAETVACDRMLSTSRPYKYSSRRGSNRDRTSRQAEESRTPQSVSLPGYGSEALIVDPVSQEYFYECNSRQLDPDLDLDNMTEPAAMSGTKAGSRTESLD